MIATYIAQFNQFRDEAARSPEEHFAAVIGFVFEDLANRETTRFLPELWAMANHNPYAADHMELIYSQYRSVLSELIGKINPSLSRSKREILALYFSASIEGHGMFVGDGKAHSKN